MLVNKCFILILDTLIKNWSYKKIELFKAERNALNFDTGELSYKQKWRIGQIDDWNFCVELSKDCFMLLLKNLAQSRRGELLIVMMDTCHW